MGYFVLASFELFVKKQTAFAEYGERNGGRVYLPSFKEWAFRRFQ